MKKSLIRFGIVLSMLGACSANAQAWGLLPGFGCCSLFGGCHDCKYANVMICKPYNAFTPFCSGITYGNCCSPCPAPCPAPCPMPCAAPCAAPCAPACADPCSTSAYRGMPMTNMAYGYNPYAYGQTMPVAYYGYYGYPTNAGYTMPTYNPYQVMPVSYMPYYWAR